MVRRPSSEMTTFPVRHLLFSSRDSRQVAHNQWSSGQGPEAHLPDRRELGSLEDPVHLRFDQRLEIRHRSDPLYEVLCAAQLGDGARAGRLRRRGTCALMLVSLGGGAFAPDSSWGCGVSAVPARSACSGTCLLRLLVVGGLRSMMPILASARLSKVVVVEASIREKLHWESRTTPTEAHAG